MDFEKRNLDYDVILEAFKKGDTDVSDIMRECGEYLGIGLANLINIFNPQRIIINGDILLKCGYIYETAVSEANGRAHEQFIKDIKFEKIDIGAEEAVKGVSLYVADKLFDLSGPDF